MRLKDIPVPEIYKSSADFRFFLDWFNTALEKVQYDTENLIDLYDPLKCPEDLLWCLADTMGYKYDDRLPAAFNRLVLLYFMSMIYNRGSRNGMILAGETNLAQFGILAEGAKDDIKYNRLENTSIPTNSVAVTSHVSEGYIDVVYFSTEIPKDACVEYVRPLGMFCFQRAGVAFDSARTKISIDAELTNEQNTNMTFGPTQVGHYRRADYATLQKMTAQSVHPGSHGYEPAEVDTSDTRHQVWSRNPVYEGNPKPLNEVNPGYRALQSLQLANNEEIVELLIQPIFTLGPDVDIEVSYPDDYYKEDHGINAVNLRYDITTEQENTRQNPDTGEYDVYTIDVERSPNAKYAAKDPPQILSVTAVNPNYYSVGDAISLNELNTEYLGDIYVTKDNDFVYETLLTDVGQEIYTVDTIFYRSTYAKIEMASTIGKDLYDRPNAVKIIRATTFNETPVAQVFIPDGVEEIE